jgi:hypothetical protein
MGEPVAEGWVERVSEGKAFLRVVRNGITYKTDTPIEVIESFDVKEGDHFNIDNENGRPVFTRRDD